MGSVTRWWGLPALLAGLALALHASLTLDHGSDVNYYHDYAVGFWGNLGHPQLPVEYPPASVLPFGLTLLPPTDDPTVVFVAWMAVVAGLGYIVLHRLDTPSAARAYAVYLVAGAGITSLYRFDLIPALAVLLAVLMVERGRFGSAYALIATGALLKLYPLALVPVVAIAEWRDHGANPGKAAIVLRAGACLAAVGASFGLGMLVDPEHALGALTYQVQRPIQTESVPASLVWIASQAGIPTESVFTFKSVNLLSPINGPVIGLTLAAGILGGLWSYRLQLRGRLSTRGAALAIVLVVLSTSKVFSAQYLIWAIPLVALVFGLDFRWLMVSVLTFLAYPVVFMVNQGTPLLATITLRNGILVYLTCRLLVEARRGPRPYQTPGGDPLAKTSEGSTNRSWRVPVKWTRTPGRPGEPSSQP